MQSPEVQSPKMPCWKKQRFRTEDAVKRGRKARKQNEGLRKGAKRLYYYKCPHCGGWHLTRMKQEK